MLPLPLNISLMLIGYALVMGYLALGLRILRRQPYGSWQPARRPARVASGRGWPGLIRQVAGTAVGGYVLLMAVVAVTYEGVAGRGGRLLASAVTGGALLVGITLPVFFLASWVAVRLQHHRRRRREKSAEE
ncbi:DUF6256 family protein [Streptomyces sp. NPDC054841]